MLRSSPRRHCHFRRDVRRCSGRMPSRMANSRSIRCGGSSMVRWIVSNNQPRMTFRVDQEASPCASFFTELGSLRRGLSWRESGRSTESMHSNNVHLAAFRWRGSNCVSMMKSSIKTSTVLRGCCNGPLLMTIGGGRLTGPPTIGGMGKDESSVEVVLARLSKRWATAERSLRVKRLLAKSAIVSVMAQR
jgi:hypothetical protein